MTRLCCTAQIVAVLCLSGCGTVEIIDALGLPESPEVAAAPYPRLIDTPDAPPVGQFSDAVPDPATGVVLEADLGAVAADSSARADTLAAPVLTEAERRRLRRAPRLRR